MAKLCRSFTAFNVFSAGSLCVTVKTRGQLAKKLEAFFAQHIPELVVPVDFYNQFADALWRGDLAHFGEYGWVFTEGKRRTLAVIAHPGFPDWHTL